MPLLERESVLETLGGWYAEARAGRGRLVLVGGEAGVGKTALVEEFAVQQRPAAQVLWGACDPLTTPRPLGPLADVAPALGGRLEQLLRDEAPREVLFPALLERLHDARVVTVLVVEDVHWADEATLDLLRFLARRIGAAPTLLVVTYRDDEVGPLHPVQLLAGDLASSAPVRRLRLAPLSPAQYARALRFALAFRYHDDGIRYCAEHDLDTWRLYMLASRARADLEQGRWTDATRTVEAVLRDPRTAPISRIEALAVLGRLRARRGDPGIWPPLDEALALATVTGELQRLGPVAIARAEAAWLDGDPAAARAMVGDVLDLAERVAGQIWP
jgi:AAA ATPase domain